MTVRLKVTLADGRVFTGPVQGNGGKVGSNRLFAGAEEAGKAAVRTLVRARALATVRRDTGLYEPEPGHVAIYPDHSAEDDGEPVAIPLMGAEFEVAT